MRTPLYDLYRQLSANMTEFAGWEMPVYFSSIIDEVRAVRTHAGIFDLSHMGELIVSEPGALDALQFVTTNDVSRLDVGRAQYTLMCNDKGGILDDLIVYRLDEERFMLVVNAANVIPDYEWIQEHNLSNASIDDQSLQTGLIAIQGPSSAEILARLVELDVKAMPRFRIAHSKVGDADAWIASTGYTGELGYELYCAASDTESIWQHLSEAGRPFGAKPAGLGARDVLRLEAGYPLYGHEMTSETTPVESRMMWAVKPEKGAFIGKGAILKAKAVAPKKLLTGIVTTDRCVPRSSYDINFGGRCVGTVTSGTFSPMLQNGIALAYVEPEYTKLGMKLQVMVRGKTCPCQVVRTPFYSSIVR